MHTILDEIIFGGQVLETSSTEVMKAVEEISKCSLSLSLSVYVFGMPYVIVNCLVVGAGWRLPQMLYRLSRNLFLAGGVDSMEFEVIG